MTPREVARRFREEIGLRLERRRISNAVGPASTIDDRLDAAFTSRWVAPVQKRTELRRLLAHVEGASRIVEIGTFRGGTLLALAAAAAPTAVIVTVDLPDSYVGRTTRRALLRSFARANQQIIFVLGDSHDLSTHDRVSAALGGEGVDLVLIDGDHSYEGIRKDVDLYQSLVRPGGLIALHDIVPGPGSGDVPQFWRDIGGGIDLVESPQQEGFGIGVQRIPSNERTSD